MKGVPGPAHTREVPLHTAEPRPPAGQPAVVLPAVVLPAAAAGTAEHTGLHSIHNGVSNPLKF